MIQDLTHLATGGGSIYILKESIKDLTTDCEGIRMRAKGLDNLYGLLWGVLLLMNEGVDLQGTRVVGGEWEEMEEEWWLTKEMKSISETLTTFCSRFWSKILINSLGFLALDLMIDMKSWGERTSPWSPKQAKNSVPHNFDFFKNLILFFFDNSMASVMSIKSLASSCSSQEESWACWRRFNANLFSIFFCFFASFRTLFCVMRYERYSKRWG